MTMYYNKALQMDPLASRLVNPVTYTLYLRGKVGTPSHQQLDDYVLLALFSLILKNGY